MAVYAELADGRRLEFPDGTDPSVIERTVKRILASEAPPKEGIGAAFMGGLERLGSTARTGLEALLDGEAAAKAGLERQKAISEKYAPGADLEAVKKAYEERGLLPAAGEAISQIPGALAEQAPNIASALASARLGAMAGSPFGPLGAVVGGGVGAVAPSLLQLFGSGLERQAEEGVDISRGRALAAAVPGAAAEAAATFIPLGRTLIGKVLGPEAEKALARGNRAAVERVAKESLLGAAARGAGVGVFAEMPAEVIQQMLERAQAGLDLTSDDALAEYGQAAYGAGLVGTPFGAVGRIGQRSVAKGQLAEEERKAKAEEARAAAEAEAKRKASPEYRTELAQKIQANKTEIDQIKQLLKDKTLDETVVADAKARVKELESETRDLVAEFKQGTPEEELPTLEKALAKQAAQAAGAEEVPLFTTEEAARDRAPFSLLPSTEFTGRYTEDGEKRPIYTDQQAEQEADRAKMEAEFERENQVLLQEIRDIDKRLEDSATPMQELQALTARKRTMVAAQEELAKKAKAQNIALRKPPAKLQQLFEKLSSVNEQLKDKTLTPEKRMVLQSEDYKLRSEVVEQTDAYKDIDKALKTATKQLEEARAAQDPNKIDRAVNKVNELRARQAQLTATPGLFDKENLLRMEQRQQALKELEEDQGVKSFIGNLYDRIGEYKQKVAAKEEQRTALAQRQQSYEQAANKLEGLMSTKGVELLGVTPERRQKIEAMIADGSLPPSLAKEIFGIEDIKLDTLRDEVQKIMQRRDERTESFLNGDVEFLTNREEQQKLVAQINELEQKIAPFQKIVANINAKKAEGLTAADKKARADARREINKLDKQIAPLREQMGVNAVLTREGAAAVKDEVRLGLLGQLLVRQKQVAQERAQPQDLFGAEDFAETVFTGQYDENGQPVYVSKALGQPALAAQEGAGTQEEIDPELRYKQDKNLTLSYFNDAIIGLQRGAFAGTRPTEDPYEIERNRRLKTKLDQVDAEIAQLREQISTPNIDPRVADNMARRVTQLEGRRKIIRAGMTEAFEGAAANFDEVVAEANKLADTYSENAVAEINAARAAKGLPPLEGAALREFYQSLPPGDAPRVGTTPSLLDFFRGKFGEFIERASVAKASIGSAQNRIDELRRAIQALAGNRSEQAETRRSELQREVNALEASLKERAVPETQRPFAKIHSALGVLREGLDDVTAIAKGEQTELQKANETLAVEPFAQAVSATNILPESRKSELRSLVERLEQIDAELEKIPDPRYVADQNLTPLQALERYVNTLKAERDALEKLTGGSYTAADMEYMIDVATTAGPFFDYYPKGAAFGPELRTRLAEIIRQLPALERQLEQEKGKVSPRKALETERAEAAGKVAAIREKFPVSEKAQKATDLLQKVLKDRSEDVERLESELPGLLDQAKKAPKASAALIEKIQQTKAAIENFKDTIAKTKKALAKLDADNTFTYSQSERTAFASEKTKQRDTFEAALEVANDRVSILKELFAFTRNDYPQVEKLIKQYYVKKEELQKLLTRKDKVQAQADIAKAKDVLGKKEAALKIAQTTHTQKKAALARTTTPAGKAKAKEALKEAAEKLDAAQFDFANAQADLAAEIRAEKTSVTQAARDKAKRAVETAGEKLLSGRERMSDFTELVLLDQDYYQQKYVELPSATTDEQKQAIQAKIDRIVQKQKDIEQAFEDDYKDVLEEFGLKIEFPSDLRAKAAESIQKANASFKLIADNINEQLASFTEKVLKEPILNAPALRKQYQEVKQKIAGMALGTRPDPKDFNAARALLDKLADEIIRTPPTKAKAYRQQLDSLRKELTTLEQERVQFIAEREVMYISGYAKYVDELRSQVAAILPRAQARQKRLQGAVNRFAEAQKMQQQRTDKEVDALDARINRMGEDLKKSTASLEEAARQAEAQRRIGTIKVKGQELPVLKVTREEKQVVVGREVSDTLPDVEQKMAALEQELGNPELDAKERKSKQGALDQLRGVRYQILLTEDPMAMSNELVQLRENIRKEKDQKQRNKLRNRERTLVALLEQVGITDVVAVKQDGKKAMKVVSVAKVKPWYEEWTHANGTPVEAALKSSETPNYTLQAAKVPTVNENLLIANARSLLNDQLAQAQETITALEKERASPQAIRAAKALKTGLEQRLDQLSLRKMTSEMSEKEIDQLVKDAALSQSTYTFTLDKPEKAPKRARVKKTAQAKLSKLVEDRTVSDELQADGSSVSDLKDVGDLFDNFGIKPTFDPRIGDAPVVSMDYDVAESVLTEVQKKVAKNKIKFVFYRNVRALPKDLKEQIIAQGLTPVVNGIKGGVAPDGTVFVIVENHSSLLDLEKTLTHEFVGHYSFESLLGPDGMAKLTKRVNASFGSVMKLAEQLGVLNEAEATYVSGLKSGLTPEQAEVKALKEVIAYTTEARVTDSFLQKAGRWIKEMIGAFRARLRELGLAKLSKLNTNDLFYMIRQAKRDFEAGKPLAYQAADGTVSFRGAVAEAPRTGIEGMIATKGKTYDMVKSNVMGLAGRVKFLDRFAALEALVNRGVEKGIIASLKAADVMYFARMADQRHTVTAQVATNGPPKLVKTKDGELMYESGDGPSLKDVSEALKDSGLLPNEVEVAFTAYAIARRAKRVGVEKLDFSGKKVTRKDVEQALAKYGSNKAFQKAFELYQDYNAGLIDFVVATGAMSKQKGAELKRYRDYVPFYRVQDGQAVLELFGEGYIRIGDIKNQPYLRELIGGEEGVLPIFTSALQNTTLLTDMALKNMATRNAAYVMRDLGVAEIHKVKGGGMGPSGSDIIRFKRDGENYWAKVDTKAKEVLFGDIPTELVVTGMEGLKAVIPDGIRLLGKPANWLRSFVTRDPRYAFRQVFRDSMSAALTTGADFVPVVQTLKDMATMKKSGALEKLQKRFIVGGQVVTGASDDMVKILQQINSGKVGWELAMSKLDELAMRGDAATRVSMYNSFIKQGLSERDATFATLEAMNFGRRGVSPTVFYANTLIPFFNASLQGLDVLYRAWTGKMPQSERLQVKKKLFARGAMMFLMTMAYAAAMEDEEEYKNANTDERYNNWFVPTPLGALRVPIPFEVGLIFKGTGEGLYRLMATDDKASDVAGALKDLALRSVPIDLPASIKPVVELMLNKSFFTDREIVDASMPQEAKYQYRPNTPEVIKMFGSVGISPAQLEYLIKGYTGSALVSMLRFFDPVFGGEIVKPDMRVTDIPVVGGLFQPKDAGGLINAAYNSSRQIQSVQATYNRLLQENPDEAEVFLNKNLTNMSLASASGEFREQMGELTQWERSVRGSKTMTGEEKRSQLDEVRRLKIQLAQIFNNIKLETERLEGRSGFQ